MAASPSTRSASGLALRRRGWRGWAEKGGPWLLLAYTLIVWALSLAVFVSYWPEVGNDGKVTWGSCSIFLPCLATSASHRLVVMVFFAGTIGACLHSGKSLAHNVARGTFAPQWSIWYIVQPLLGATLALVFFLLMAGETPIGAPDKIPYAILATGLLVGMFSRQAINKLVELLDTLLRTPSKSGGTAAATAGLLEPKIESLAPATLAAGGAGQTIVATGSGFTTTTAISVNGIPRQTEFVSSTELRFDIAVEDIAAPAALTVIAETISGRLTVRSEPASLEVVPNDGNGPIDGNASPS